MTRPHKYTLQPIGCSECWADTAREHGKLRGQIGIDVDTSRHSRQSNLYRIQLRYFRRNARAGHRHHSLSETGYYEMDDLVNWQKAEQLRQ